MSLSICQLPMETKNQPIDSQQIKWITTFLFARPDGKSDQHFEQMQDKVETWTARIKSGQIPTKSVWMSYTNQLWAGLRYGLGACSVPLSELREGLRKADYQLLSNLGVTRSITK